MRGAGNTARRAASRTKAVLTLRRLECLPGCARRPSGSRACRPPRGRLRLHQPFSESDPEKIDVPTLIIHGDDDQIVRIDGSGRLSAQAGKNAEREVCPRAGHGLFATHKKEFNDDLLAFFNAHPRDGISNKRRQKWLRQVCTNGWAAPSPSQQ